MRVSIIIPTLNSAATLAECLEAIREQDWPREELEIIVADAGSTDATLELARKFGVDKIVPNPLKTGEAGKSAAVRNASGELLALIDSDNILPSPDWLRVMAAPFVDPEVIAAEPFEYTARDSDPATTRYFARLGMNDPLCLFIGNYDRVCAVTGKWTELPVECEDMGGWLKLRLDSARPLPTIGANGFIIRKSALAGVAWEPYWFDVDIVRDAAALSPSGTVCVAKVRCGIVHVYCATLADFARKQKRRVRDFLYFSPNRSAAKPARGARRMLVRGILRFVAATLLWFPLALQARRGNAASPDREAWRLHAAACRITLRTYALGVVGKIFGRNKPADRSAWKQ
jgi:Glycosyltransferases involved in cell wall biogenesis